MKIEIMEEMSEKTERDIVRFYEGTISASDKIPVFFIGGDEYRINLLFEKEEEIDELIKALQYFKKKKTFPPTE